MNTFKTLSLYRSILLCITSIVFVPTYAQSSMPEVLDTGTIEQQLNYLEERTRIYSDFRAIREDMFQKIKTNTNDSLITKKNNVLQLEGKILDQGNTIDSLRSALHATNQELELAIKNRNRLAFLGIPMHKVLYNTIMWIAIAALAFLTGILFLSSKRALSSAKRNKHDLEELREEFETYRKETRERQEQLVVKHHNELKKLKGK